MQILERDKRKNFDPKIAHVIRRWRAKKGTMTSISGEGAKFNQSFVWHTPCVALRRKKKEKGIELRIVKQQNNGFGRQGVSGNVRDTHFLLLSCFQTDD